jgi:hypothetical protein
MSDPREQTPIQPWTTQPEWQSHAIEALLGDELDPKYMARSHARGLAVHRSDSLQRMLVRWAKGSRFRNGQAILEREPQQIISRNVYQYDLRISTEVRSEPHAKRIPLPQRYLPSDEAPQDIWEVAVPETPRYAQVKPTAIRIPGATHVVVCEDCDGQGQLLCADCIGRGVVERPTKIRAADGSVTVQNQERTCAPCQGSGMIACRRCTARGELLEEHMFLWSRTTQTHHAEDDPTTPNPRVLSQHAQVVFRDAVRFDDVRWQQIPALAELITHATSAHAHDGIVLDAELTIRATPLTDVVYQIGGRKQTVAVIGFTNVVSAERGFYDWQRIAMGVTIALVVSAAVLLAFLSFR